MAEPTPQPPLAPQSDPDHRWSGLAVCADHPHELFFPHGREEERHNTPRALAICRNCPVRAACLRHALIAPERFGIWGGTTASQRGWDKHGKRHKYPPILTPAA